MPKINIKVTPTNPNLKVALFPSSGKGRPLENATTGQGQNVRIPDGFHTAVMLLERGNVGDEFTLTVTGKNTSVVVETAKVQSNRRMITDASFRVLNGAVS